METVKWLIFFPVLQSKEIIIHSTIEVNLCSFPFRVYFNNTKKRLREELHKAICMEQKPGSAFHLGALDMKSV